MRVVINPIVIAVPTRAAAEARYQAIIDHAEL